jgi:hypothetical protein
MKKPTPCRRSSDADWHSQLSESLASVEEELARKPDSSRAHYLAALLVDLAGADVAVPRSVAEAAPRCRADVAAELAGLLWDFWFGFKSKGWLTPARAVILAPRLLVGLRQPLQLLRLRHECRELRLTFASYDFDDAINALDPGYLNAMHSLRIDRAFVCELLSPAELRDVKVACFRNGGVRRVSSRRAACRLELAETPGSATFHDEGERGGSGFLTRETYRDGAAHGTFNSPWHDGEEYADAIEWPLWVAEAVRSVADAR